MNSTNPLPNAMALKNRRFESVIQVIAAIPVGRVATYGQIAEAAQLKGLSRWVGKVLSQLPAGTSLPWHRVINSAGRITNPNRERNRWQTEDRRSHEKTVVAQRIHC